MKNHPIITAVYILISFGFVWISASLYSQFPDMGDFKNTYIAIISVTTLFVISISTIGLIQAKTKGVAQYAFYLAVIPVIFIPSFLYHSAFCQGKWCNMLDYFVVMILAVLAVSIVVIYYLGKFLSKRGYLNTFLKYAYILTIVLLAIEIPLYIAVTVFEYTFIGYTFNTGGYLFDEVSLPNDFMDIAMIVIPALIFAIYPLKIAEAEYMDKGGVVNKNN